MSSSRQVGGGSISGIQLVEIRCYLTFYPQRDEARFMEIMKLLDMEYLDAIREQMARKRTQEKSRGNTRNRG